MTALNLLRMKERTPDPVLLMTLMTERGGLKSPVILIGINFHICQGVVVS